MNNIIISSSSDLIFLSNSNTVFEIVAEINLGGNLYTIDCTSILRFNGGRLRNGILGGYINLQADSNNIFCPTTLSFANGTVFNVPFLRPEWFGAVGNYNPLTHIGSDDTVAINRTISTAEQLSIKIVKFAAVNYYTSNGIIISKGNVWLEGSGALLREEECNHQEDTPIASTTSTLYCHTSCHSCIICDQKVANPIFIRDIQFICNFEEEESYQHDVSCHGIHFKSVFEGPTWPVIIERCHFRNFLYAFFVDNSSVCYPIHALKFKDCSFLHNRYCVYFGAIGNQRLHSWSFEFIDNKCHFNSYILHVSVYKGLCIIENNNTESTYGVFESKDNSSELSEEYAIDVVLGERAHALIQHNHFEQNETPLVKITGKDGPTWATVMHNNIDGDENYNHKCLFVNTCLDTDMHGQIDQCIVNSRNFSGRILEFPVSGCNFALFRHCANGLLAKNYIRYIVDSNTVNETTFPKVFIDTPVGKKCMTRFHSEPTVGSNTERYHCLTDLTIPKRVQDKYVNYETLYYVQKDLNTLTCSACIVIYYLDANRNPIIGADGPLLTWGWKDFWSFDTGFFHLRGCAELLQNISYQYITIELRVYTDENYIEPLGAKFYGSRIIVLSDMPIPANVQLSSNYDMQITGDLGDCYMINKNDRFVSGCFDITCISDGSHIAIPNMTVLPGNELLSDPIPIGSIWNTGQTFFKITGFANTSLINGMYTYYYEILNGPQFSTVSSLQCKEPILIGHGCGQSTDMSHPIVAKLSAGSTFYNQTTNNLHVLNANNQWVVI